MINFTWHTFKHYNYLYYKLCIFIIQYSAQLFIKIEVFPVMYNLYYSNTHFSMFFVYFYSYSYLLIS